MGRGARADARKLTGAAIGANVWAAPLVCACSIHCPACLPTLARMGNIGHRERRGVLRRVRLVGVWRFNGRPR